MSLFGKTGDSNGEGLTRFPAWSIGRSVILGQSDDSGEMSNAAQISLITEFCDTQTPTEVSAPLGRIYLGWYYMSS